jgi:hypothetical protein
MLNEPWSTPGGVFNQLKNKRKYFLIFLSIMFAVLLSAGCDQKVVSTSSSPDTKAIVPQDLSFATDLVKLLGSSGLVVKKVAPSVYASFFKQSNKAALIETDFGTVDVVFFPKEEAANIQITNEQKNGQYFYNIDGKEIQANRPFYMTMKRNLFLMTDSPALDLVMKQALNN